MPVYRRTPEDFEVEEELSYQPEGSGDHLYVLVEKRDRTTEQIARQIAASVDCSPSEVGYAGRKDRRAVARQWFSAPDSSEGLSADALELDGATVVAVSRHRHKLRTGKLRSNRFRLVVGDVSVGSVGLLERRLAQLARWGFPNRYGHQRFGRDGDNAELGQRLLERRARPRDRRAARFLVSALQSALFNRQIERRGELFEERSVSLESAGDRPIDRLLVGDLAVKTTGGVFEVEDADVEQQRADVLEISPSGLLFGRKARAARALPGELERSVLEERGLETAPRLPGVRFDGARRALRVRPNDLEWTFREESLMLQFELPAGSYASVLLEEVFSGLELVEAQRPAADVASPSPSD